MKLVCCRFVALVDILCSVSSSIFFFGSLLFVWFIGIHHKWEFLSTKLHSPLGLTLNSVYMFWCSCEAKEEEKNWRYVIGMTEMLIENTATQSWYIWAWNSHSARVLISGCDFNVCLSIVRISIVPTRCGKCVEAAPDKWPKNVMLFHHSCTHANQQKVQRPTMATLFSCWFSVWHEESDTLPHTHSDSMW